MDSIEAVRQDLTQKGFFTVHRVPDSCPICKKKYLKRVEPALVALVCVTCNLYEYFLPLKNGKFLTDGIGRELVFNKETQAVTANGEEFKNRA